MLSKILNSQINHNINQINRLNYINNKKFTTKTQQNLPIEKYKDITIPKVNFFTISTDHNIKNLDIIISDNGVDEDNNLFKINNNIRKINYVYKINFKNVPATGFGDFIRGCYFLLQFSEKNNVRIDFHIYDSVIKNYLNFFKDKKNIEATIADNIYKFTNTNVEFTNCNKIIDYKINNDNDNEFIFYLNSCKLYSNNIYINTVNFPTHNISKQHIDFIRNILDPVDSIKLEVINLLKQLKLNTKKYITYHIRLGDDYLNNQNSTIKIEIINKILNSIVINDTNNYLIVSDSVIIKKIIKNRHPNVKYLMKQFKHTIDNNINDVKHTLIDFYLMSFSQSIISYSIYPHGSGFSKWCAVTYEIPYICYSLF